MRYLVTAKVKSGKSKSLLRSIAHGTLGKGSIAGDEYIYNMKDARVNSDGVATWVETCFCDPPLAEERPYWEEYFELVTVQDAHSRRNCRHENGTKPWARLHAKIGREVARPRPVVSRTPATPVEVGAVHRTDPSRIGVAGD